MAEVQKSQGKMWGAISKMGEELRDLATREGNSESTDEEQEAGSGVSQEKVPEAPRTVTNPIPLFGIPPKAPTVSFRTFDEANVRDLVCSIVPKQFATPKQEG